MTRRIMSFFIEKSTKFHCYDTAKSLFKNIDIDNVIDTLKKDGISSGIILPEDVVQDILDFAFSTRCYGNGQPSLGFYVHEKEQVQAKHKNPLLTAVYFNAALNCPAISRIERDPYLLEIAKKYLGKNPIHLGNRLWWSFVTEATESDRSQAAQMFHYDLDDYRFLKFFFYLTDVDLANGPHVCVRGTHERKKFLHWLLLKRYPDKEIISSYGSESIVTLCGNAGFGFAEDTLCFHKGYPPTIKDRLILQIQFALNDYGLQNDKIDTSLLKPII
ncbi:MAG: hypothetical protein RIG63_16120 [Coleofasciculus chthonoplastes F3-SA18-01]|uniref:phytanoyl-CoA dioxygenase family protein n=1 Tax=Coleofasciculus chthonoplastes TaxID=64178 RepID=UPI0032FFE5A9